MVYDYEREQIGFAEKVDVAPGGIGLNAQNTAGSVLDAVRGTSRNFQVPTIVLGAVLSFLFGHVF